MRKLLGGLGFFGLLLLLSWCDVLLEERKVENAFRKKEEKDILLDPASMAGDSGLVLAL